MAEQPLALRDIIMPDLPSYWPLAPGWWGLILLAFITLAILVRHIVKLRRNKKALKIRQQALQLGYQHIIEAFYLHHNKHQLAADSSAYLRRIVRFEYQDELASTLTVKPWMNYLANTNSAGKLLSEEFSAVLCDAGFNPKLDFDSEPFIAAVQDWLALATKNANKGE